MLLQLTELQFYINNIARCLGIVDILSARRQYHKFNTFTNILLATQALFDFKKFPDVPENCAVRLSTYLCVIVFVVPMIFI